MCGSAASDSSIATAVATVDFRLVSALIQGGALGRSSGSSAAASAIFTESLTLFGGTGRGTLTISESDWTVGTGSLSSFSSGFSPIHRTYSESFVFGTPFTVTLSAYAASSFIGTYCDGGSLLVQKQIESLTYVDSTGVRQSAMGGAAAPEPSTWVLAGIGVLLVFVAKSRVIGGRAARPESGREAEQNQD